jgi:hypothetical protein
MRREKGERKGRREKEKGKNLAFPLNFLHVYLIYIYI